MPGTIDKGEENEKSILTALSILLIAIPVEAADGVVNVQSSLNVEQTADRMETILKEKGMTLFNRIKHSEVPLKLASNCAIQSSSYSAIQKWEAR